MGSFKTIRKNIKYTLLVAVLRVLLIVIRALPRKVSIRFMGRLGAWFEQELVAIDLQFVEEPPRKRRRKR